ncbi:MAG: 50S ribosomal protein L31 [bacterium]
MKDDIHPKYFKTTATCACGATYDIGSTNENIRVDICSNCHPLFTGKQKFMDAEGRVERFKKKYSKVAAAAPAKKPKKRR